MYLSNYNNFRIFFQDFFEPIYRFALKYTEDHDSARDIAQETFIRLYERRNDFDSQEKAKSFAYITAKNSSLDYLKHQKIERRYFKSVQSDSEELTFIQEVTYQETFRIVHSAIQKLTPQCRAIILLNLNEKNNAEIAEEMAISINTVKTLKKNAYKTLRNILGKHYLILLMLFAISDENFFV
ncbi:MAG: sigma-70 family RNA polymerase sigma factor [Prevotellaceae bacterium]|jgi:RNA polymerase sigma-70 factor (ECF subfamily)|nr:sigma-70 family RNA polymerase sigma factor [Prevotellaceae bacterium]